MVATYVKLRPALLHATAASIMAYGYLNLHNLVADQWIRQQKGGHFQFLTIQGLCIALLTMVFSLGSDLFPSSSVLKNAKRFLLALAILICVVISIVWWTLVLTMPNLILMPDPKEREPSSSSTVPELQRIPLAMDLALHATPAVSLVIDFLAFETKYSRKVSRYGATILAVLAGGSYAYWTEHCAAFNGTFPYPFLTYNPFHIRVVIYAGVTGLALASFWILNALHA